MPRKIDDQCPEAGPQLAIGLNIYCLEDLPNWSVGPRDERPESLRRIAAAGFAGMQSFTAAPALAAGLRAFGFGRVDRANDATEIAARHRAEGFECTTLHVGTGFESDDEALRLIDAILEASARTGHPLYVETHRATVTQDMRRTLDLIERRPEIRLNLDFCHYYTGSEMTYGDLDWKLSQLQPVFARTRFIHGRISDPGNAQISMLDARCAAHRAVFERVWGNVFSHFRSTAEADDTLIFCPEILAPKHFYGATDGHGQELTDRWLEAIETANIARRAWASPACE